MACVWALIVFTTPQIPEPSDAGVRRAPSAILRWFSGRKDASAQRPLPVPELGPSLDGRMAGQRSGMAGLCLCSASTRHLD